jgi:hypothetical protein
VAADVPQIQAVYDGKEKKTKRNRELGVTNKMKIRVGERCYSLGKWIFCQQG